MKQVFFPLKRSFKEFAVFGLARRSVLLLRVCGCCVSLWQLSCLAYTASTEFHIVSVEYFVEFVGSPKVFVDIKV